MKNIKQNIDLMSLEECNELIEKATVDSIDELLELISNLEHYEDNLVILKQSFEEGNEKKLKIAYKELRDDLSIKKQALVEVSKWFDLKFNKAKIKGGPFHDFITNYKPTVRRIVRK